MGDLLAEQGFQVIEYPNSLISVGIRFIRALNGEYVPAGEGNDPLRNLAAIPTGKNFYGFSPAKVPTKVTREAAKGMGNRFGVAYRLEDGSMVYVPDEKE